MAVILSSLLFLLNSEERHTELPVVDTDAVALALNILTVITRTDSQCLLVMELIDQ